MARPSPIIALFLICSLTLGCTTDGDEDGKPVGGDDETQTLAVQQIDKLVDQSKSTTAGKQIVTIENLSDKTIWASTYHNGCDIDAVVGLCHYQSLAPKGLMTYKPDDVVRDYNDIVRVFTYVAEAIQLAVSVALTVVTGGAGSALIAAEAAEIAGETAEVVTEAGIETAISASEGAEAAGTTVETAVEEGVSVAVETSGGNQAMGLSWSQQMAINFSVSAPLQTIKGGLNGGYMHGLSGAMNGLLQAVENAAINAVLQPKAVGAVAGALGAAGATTARNGLQAVAEMEEWTFGKLSQGSGKFWSLFKKAPSAADTEGAVAKALANGVSSANPKRAMLLKALKQVFQKGTAKTKHYYQLAQKEIQKDKAAKASEGLVVLRYVEGEDQVGGDGTSTDLAIDRGHLRQLIVTMLASPEGAAELEGLTDGFVDQNVAIDRAVQVLAVSHNLYIHTASLQSKLGALFGTKVAIGTFYDDHLPPQLLDAAKKLNEYYHLALCAEDHTLYAKLNVTLTASDPVAAVREELEGRDLATEGFAIKRETLKTYGYAPVAKLNTLDRQQVQNLLMFSRMAMGIPVPIQLWSNKEWNYTVDYNTKLYRNIAGFFRNHAANKPSYDYWHAPWYPPGHPKHNKFWQEVVGYTNRLGSFVSGRTKWDGTGLHPVTEHLYVDDDNQLELHSEPISDEDWDPILDIIAKAFGSDKDSVVLVTFSRDESISWWKGLTVTYPALEIGTGKPLGIPLEVKSEIGDDGKSDTFLIPLGQLPSLVKSGAYPAALTHTAIEFQAAKTFGIHYPVGATLYQLMDFAGKHVRINWVHDGGRDSDFYDVPNTYDVDGDGVNMVESTQTPRDDDSAAIIFAIGPGISWWKGIALQTSKGKKFWLGTQDNVIIAPGGIGSTDPVKEWGEYVHVELWKAAFLGIHTYQKRIKIKTSSLVGQNTLFNWKSDGTNYTELKSGYTADGGHDKISVDVAPLPANQSQPGKELCLVMFKAGPDITWWKALQLRMINGGKAISYTQDSLTTGIPFWMFQAALPDQSQEFAVEFWKAKFLGIHTYVGEAKITWDSVKGKQVTFTWEND